MIKQENELDYVLCHIEYDHIGSKEDSKKRVMEAEDQRKNKYEQNQMRYDDERLRGLETCELFRSVLAFGMYHINNLKVKDLRVLLCYHSGSENLKEIPNKVEHVEAVKDFL